MELILREDVQGLGVRGDLVSVKDGYARNYLLPQGLAVLATDAQKRIIEKGSRVFLICWLIGGGSE